jgi:hypothetical protein
LNSFRTHQMKCLITADGKWDLEEYRNGAVGWCRYVTGISDIDAAYETLMTVWIFSLFLFNTRLVIYQRNWLTRESFAL